MTDSYENIFKYCTINIKIKFKSKYLNINYIKYE